MLTSHSDFLGGFIFTMKKKKKQKSPNAFLQEKAKQFSKELVQNATKWELSFKRKLEKTKIPFIFQYPVICNNEKLFILDFYLPKYKIGIELDGQWHYTPDMIKRDKLRTRLLKKEGITILRIANCMEDQIKPEQIIELVKSLVGLP